MLPVAAFLTRQAADSDGRVADSFSSDWPVFARSADSAVKTLRFRLMVWNAGARARRRHWLFYRRAGRSAADAHLRDGRRSDGRRARSEPGRRPICTRRRPTSERRPEDKDPPRRALLLERSTARRASTSTTAGSSSCWTATNGRCGPATCTPNLGAASTPCRTASSCRQLERVPGCRRAASSRRRGRPLRIRVGAPMDFIDRDIASIDALAERGVALLLVVAPLAGYWLAGRAVRPLAAIIKTTAGLRPNRMEERLADRSNGRRAGPTVADGQPVSRPHRRLFEPEQRPLGQLGPRAAHAAGRDPQRGRGRARRRPDAPGIPGTSDRGDRRMRFARAAGQPALAPGGDRFRTPALAERAGRVERAGPALRRDVQRRRGSAAHRAAKRHRAGDRGRRVRHIICGKSSTTCWTTRSNSAAPVERSASSCSATADGAAVLRVRDTGCGIPAADLPHIFERFFRGDKSRQRLAETTGTGLGLSICQAIVAAHGGQILVESQEGVGTTMTVRLPATRESKAAGPPSRAGEPPEPADALCRPAGDLTHAQPFVIVLRSRQRS